MSKGFNMSILVGNLGKDPRMAYSAKGLPICNFDMATSERFKSEGEFKETTEWHRIVVFGTFAETCGEKLKKGSQVFITGRKNTREYDVTDDKGTKTGETRKVVEVIARDIIFTGKAPVMPKEHSQIPDNVSEPDDDDIPF